MKTSKSLFALLVIIITTMSITLASPCISFEQGTIEAIGTGLPPAGATYPQATALAKRAAIVDAYRNLAEQINGVQINSFTTVYNLQMTNDVIKTQVSGFIKGAKVISEQELPDGTYQVVMQLPLYGQGSLAGIVYPSILPHQPHQAPLPTKPISLPDSYTGVIIDARGLGLEPAFSPAIFDETGRAIYGTKFINADFAIKYGMVEYTVDQSMFDSAEYGQSRAGEKPLIVKAVEVRDRHNVIISTEDADKILAANQQNNFLRQCAVVFAR